MKNKLLVCIVGAVQVLFVSTAFAGLGPNLNPSGLDSDPVHVYNPPPAPPPTTFTIGLRYNRGDAHHRAH